MDNISKPDVGLIGAGGVMGSRLLRRMLDAGYSVHAHDINTAILHVMQATGRSIVVHESVANVVAEVDVVILAVPYPIEQRIAAHIGSDIGNRIVVSITNPLTPTLDDVVTPPDESAAEHLCRLMPSARVVKALNTISAASLDLPALQQTTFDTFVASDDRAAAAVIERMIQDIGYRPWYVGGLILSRTLERMSALLIGISQRYALEGALGWRVEQVQPSLQADI